MSGTRIGIDVGGTFTDGVALEPDGTLRIAKVRSRPDDIAAAILDCARELRVDPAEVTAFVHGTTVGTNAIIEKSGPAIAHITTRGFRDILFIRRGDSEPFNLRWRPPAAVVARRDIYEITERLRFDGAVEIPFDEAEARRVAQIIAEKGYPAVSVTFLHSYVNPDHELRMKAILEELAPGIDVSISHEVLPHYREFERSSTTAVNAYLVPLVRDYLDRLAGQAEEAGFGCELLVMQSSGGVTTTGQARRFPARTVRSGPAGGAVAAVGSATDIEIGDAILIDIGGTSTEVAVLRDGRIRQTAELEFAWGVPIRFPSVDIHSVGAGGGSIAWVDGQFLKVGPQSAGADPGPACYGRGGEQPTTTDAQVVLGRLHPETLLGGTMPIDRDLAAEAITRHVGEPLGLDLEAAALGIIEVNTNHLVQAIRLMTVNRGFDPRGATLIAYGGGGPLYAADALQILGLSQVVVPPNGGVASALGMVLADFSYDESRTVLAPHADVAPSDLEAVFGELEAVLSERLDHAGVPGDRRHLERALDIRYDGQGYEVTVPVAGRIDAAVLEQAAQDFHALHERELGWRDDSWPLEIVFARASATGRHGAQAGRPSVPAGNGAPPTPEAIRDAWFLGHGAPIATPVYERAALPAGTVLTGPTIVEQLDTTTIVPPGISARVHPNGSLLLTPSTSDTIRKDSDA